MLSFKSIWSEMTLKAYPVMGNENVWLSKKKKKMMFQENHKCQN